MTHRTTHIYRNDRDHIDALEASLDPTTILDRDQVDDILDATCTGEPVSLFTAVGLLVYDPATDTLTGVQS